MTENRFFFLRNQRTLGRLYLAEHTWITEQACKEICSLVTLEIGSLDLLSDLLIRSVSPGYSEVFFFFLLKRVILFSLVFCVLLKGRFQDRCILLSPSPLHLMETESFASVL